MGKRLTGKAIQQFHQNQGLYGWSDIVRVPVFLHNRRVDDAPRVRRRAALPRASAVAREVFVGALTLCVWAWHSSNDEGGPSRRHAGFAYASSS